LPELGLVGEPLACRLTAVEQALEQYCIAVVTPTAVGPLNVNADEAAAALAAGLGADRVVFVSDVPGVYLEGAVVGRLHADDAEVLLGSGAFEAESSRNCSPRCALHGSGFVPRSARRRSSRDPAGRHSVTRSGTTRAGLRPSRCDDRAGRGVSCLGL
jgi:hypothetical protein